MRRWEMHTNVCQCTWGEEIIWKTEVYVREYYYGMFTRCYATTAKQATIQQPLLSNVFVNKHVFTAKKNTAIMDETFTARSVPKCYKQDQLSVAVIELMGFSRCELSLLEASSWGRGQVGNPEEGERPQLEAVTEQRPWRRWLWILMYVCNGEL
jgi:hypothetical protein